TEFDLILNKIDRELLSSNQEQLIENSFTSIGDFFNIGGGDKNKISLTAVEIFFKEKNLIELLVKLQKAIPGEIKKQYDKQEIERILFSPERELETKTDKKEEPEEEPVEEDTEVSEPDVEPEFEESENNSSVGFEKPSAESFLTPEEEQALLSLYNEEPKVDEEIENTSSEMKTIESQDIEFENVETESTEEETITQLVEGPAEQVNEPKDEFEDIVDAISEDFNSEETKTEEQTIEEDSELIVTEIDKMADDTESEIKPGLEKEIVQEMIKDFYGEGESDTTIQDETEQESIEIPESVPEEESKNRIETLEDELLNIFEGLDKEDKPVEEVKETLPPEEEINEEKKPLKPKDTDGLDDYLKSIDEAVFSDKKEKMDEEKKEIEVKESVKEPEKKVEETKKDISTVLKDTLSRDSIEQPVITPRNIRPKDLFSYLRRKDIKKITLLIFGNDEEDFMNTAERIMDCHSYKEASEILKAVFTSYKISPYSKEAITFTNSVSNYFRQA
ncbi:MAG: hypothetical protein OQK64_03445, partial [Ignavibacteriaceae bacterium]|nr:hypothetical protein [Ignavibacteriaceae bacterium]